MRRVVILCLAAGVCIPSPAGGANKSTGNTQPIPDVRSVHALRKLPPVHGIHGWVFRLGLADSGVPGDALRRRRGRAPRAATRPARPTGDA